MIYYILVATKKGIRMKELYIANMKTGTEFIDFFMVKAIELKIGSNKKQYLDVTVSDCTGEINGKKWDVNDEEAKNLEKIEAGDFIKLKAIVTEWNGTKQLRIIKIRKGQKDDKLEPKDYIKAAPEDSEDMWKYIHDVANGIGDKDLREICLRLLKDNREKLMYYPAAMSNHHAEYGGLLYHVKRMMMMGERACEVYTNLNRDLLIAGVAIHDIEKLNEIDSDEFGVVPDYTLEGKMLGHLVMGVAAIHDRCEELGIDREKALMLEHMAISHHYEPEFGSPRKPLFPEAEMLHYLDMVDAKMFDMEDALANVEPGGFSEKVFTLDNRKLYKRTF